MTLKPTVIVVPANASPRVRLKLKRDGQPFDFYDDQPSLAFYVKGDPSDPEGPPLYSTPGSITVIGPANAGTVLIAFNAANHPDPGSWFFRIDQTRNARSFPVAQGRLHVQNT